VEVVAQSFSADEGPVRVGLHLDGNPSTLSRATIVRVGDEDIGSAISAAHDRAVAEAFGLIERKRGHGSTRGRGRRLRLSGLDAELACSFGFAILSGDGH